ncbi:hypothetical protein ElyMa_003457700 [Elysia marginata]|uniref:Uncharacterized protein n=1 Tax=Elysia marginata TaxID=1093978 RepID=A0AAV4E8G7_9GAST|nr:hypothetical protein ElyMa_003457700 [Elysia marginata]
MWKTISRLVVKQEQDCYKLTKQACRFDVNARKNVFGLKVTNTRDRLPTKLDDCIYLHDSKNPASMHSSMTTKYTTSQFIQRFNPPTGIENLKIIKGPTAYTDGCSCILV